MWKFLTQNTRRASFESTDNLVWLLVGRGFNEQVDVIWLNCQLQDRPPAFLCDFFADFIEALGNVTNQYFLAPFRYPNGNFKR